MPGVDEAQIELAVAERLQLIGRVLLGQRTAHPRQLLLAGLQGLRQAAIEHGADEAHAQPPGRALGHLASLGCGLVRLGQQAAGRALKCGAGGRQSDVATAALEQLRADAVLQLANRHRQRRL